jgi:polyphenol oxidase
MLYSTKNFYTLSSFNSFPEVVHGTSTRSSGDMRRFNVANDSERIWFLKTVGIPRGKIIRMQQKHTGNVELVTRESPPMIPTTDGLVTKERNMYICAVTGDCLPVMFYDNRNHSIGVAHAGYKSILGGIVANMVDAMRSVGSNPEDIYVGVGPGIGVCCYEFGADMVSLFSAYTDSFQIRDGTYYVDLKGIAKQALNASGVLSKNIEISSVCTRDSIKDFFSARTDSKETYGEMATIIGMIDL